MWVKEHPLRPMRWKGDLGKKTGIPSPCHKYNWWLISRWFSFWLHNKFNLSLIKVTTEWCWCDLEIFNITNKSIYLCLLLSATKYYLSETGRPMSPFPFWSTTENSNLATIESNDQVFYLATYKWINNITHVRTMWGLVWCAVSLSSLLHSFLDHPLGPSSKLK